MPQCGLRKWSSSKNSLITLKTVINHKKNIKKQCKSCPSSHNHENRFLCEDLTARTWNCGLIWIQSILCPSVFMCAGTCKCAPTWVTICPVALPSRCSSCWWWTKIPLPLPQIVFSRLHSVWHWRFPILKTGLRDHIFVCRRNLCT